jgi:hypothetical protein
MAVFTRQRQQDMKSSGRQRKQRVNFEVMAFHDSLISTLAISSMAIDDPDTERLAEIAPMYRMAATGPFLEKLAVHDVERKPAGT